MKIIRKIKDRIKKHPISSTLFFILLLVIITLAVPYFETSNKKEANDELINSLTNPQNLPKEFINITEDFSSDQINSIKDLTDKFSIEQIIELEKRIVSDNFDLLDFTDVEIDEDSEEFLSGSISVKKKYEDLSSEYEQLIIEYEKVIENINNIEKENASHKSKTVSLAFENQSLKAKIDGLEIKVEETIKNNEKRKTTLERSHETEIDILNDELDEILLEVQKLRDSYKVGNSYLSSTVRTGQSANFKFNWLELEKVSDNDARYLRMDLTNISETNPYNFRLMNYLPTGSMIPLLTNDTLGLVSKTKEDQEFYVGDVISYVPSKFDDSIGDMEGCDISLEGILKQNYNHISHRIIDKKWDDEIEDWNYLPKGDQNALHDGCFITSKDIKYKLEMLIKIKN
jgi:hypothetical protein